MAAAKKSKAAGVCDRGAIVDEYGRIAQECAALTPKFNRKSELEKTIAGWFADQAPDQAHEVAGAFWTAQVSPRRTERTINVLALAKKLGAKLFMQYASFSARAFDTLVPADERDKFCKSERSGSRTVKVFPRLAGL